MPLAHEVVRLVGEREFRYVYVEPFLADRVKLGWGKGDLAGWCVPYQGNEELVEKAEVLYCGIRDIGLFERRAKCGRVTYCTTERWFKPICGLCGRVRMLAPPYFRMARRFVKWLNDDANARYLAIGPWAEKDIRWLGANSGKVVPWGYFVEPGGTADRGLAEWPKTKGELHLLWVGRLLGWKRVDDIVRAVRMHENRRRTDDSLPKVTLDIYGDGVEKKKIGRLVARLGLDENARLHPSVPIADVRKLMREHDVYVLASNFNEGWGAVVSEALEEGMRVIGTYEAGASATILPATNLYHAGDWRRLAGLLGGDVPWVPIGPWTAKAAAGRLLGLVAQRQGAGLRQG